MSILSSLFEDISRDWHRLIHTDEFDRWRDRFEQEPADLRIVDDLSDLSERVRRMPVSRLKDELLGKLDHLEDLLDGLF